MNCTNATLPFTKTGYFTEIITAYLEQAEAIRPFYRHAPDMAGIKAAIAARAAFSTDRRLLVEELTKQYASLPAAPKVQEHLQLLSQPNTFTITTAHQPVIFTGPLYFIYKILHAIKLAAALREQLPEYNFVPVYYMGSEDADLEELGSIYLGSEKLTWDTKQTGAVGRMNTRGLEKLISRVEGELSVQPHGPALLQLLKDCYLNSPDLQTATLRFVHALFAHYGLVILVPDNARFKQTMLSVFEDDIFNNKPAGIVTGTIEKLSAHYKVQAHPRDINLFYLKDTLRNRIEKQGDAYIVHGTELRFTEAALRAELQEHPERFSPNVILRGMLQETLLPNIVFIGGGGETAYWLELAGLFAHYKVPYPVLLLRNSFLFVEKKWQDKIEKLGFKASDLFRTEQELLTMLVTRNKNGELKLEHEMGEVEQLYSQLRAKAGHIDKTLEPHIEALRTRALRPLRELEKKMLRAEKRKYSDAQRQIHALRETLFPRGSLQERIDNFMPYYAKWGADFIETMYVNSPSLEPQFVIVSCEE
ncbi:MAG: bacillithiol biosynthesis cysteine-adding enzyme BshC [Bacteroidetes bacterium]|nr:bacillithiol biosynthesis cysteine-adding enzyme BshC [Bacteroidota bacterium]